MNIDARATIAVLNFYEFWSPLYDVDSLKHLYESWVACDHRCTSHLTSKASEVILQHTVSVSQ